MLSARGVAREVIHRFKYNNHEYFEPMLAEWLEGATAFFPNHPDCVVPVPLHSLKERERGFNQAERLGVFVTASFGVPLKSNLLDRVVYTETQTNLSRKERMANMKGAFCAAQNESHRRILLVDDVMTTGATASACADALLRARASDVNVLTLARGQSV